MLIDLSKKSCLKFPLWVVISKVLITGTLICVLICKADHE